MPPQVPYYDPKSPGLQYNVAKAKEELAKSTVPKGFTATFEAVAGLSSTSRPSRRSCRRPRKPLGIKINILKKDANAWQADWQNATYPGMNNSYWTMDIADPDELVSFAVDPSQGAHSFQTCYNNPVVDEGGPAGRRASSIRRSARCSTRRSSSIAAEDAFMAFLYYSPFRYAFSNKVHGLPGLPDRQLPHGGRLAAEVAGAVARAGTSWIVSPTCCGAWHRSCRSSLGVTMLTFLLVHLLPGDPAGAVLGNRATPELVAQLHEKWGLDRSLPEQYWLFVQRLAHGDLGDSLLYGVAVALDDHRARCP